MHGAFWESLAVIVWSHGVDLLLCKKKNLDMELNSAMLER